MEPSRKRILLEKKKQNKTKQFNIRQTLSLRFLTSPDTGPTNLESNNFEIFTFLKDDFCSVRLLHNKMLKESPSSRSHASSL